MVSGVSRPQAASLCSYVIASADMYYGECNLRVVRVRDDPEKGFQIWGEIPDSGSVSAVNLCEVLLEYALTCQAVGDPSVARQNMDIFAKKLGQALADYIVARVPAETAKNVCACAMECVLESMNVHFYMEQTGGELRFVLERCPLHESTMRTGLTGEELAHYGIQVLCQTLVQAFDPNLSVRVPLEADAEHVFVVSMPSYT